MDILLFITFVIKSQEQQQQQQQQQQQHKSKKPLQMSVLD